MDLEQAQFIVSPRGKEALKSLISSGILSEGGGGGAGGGSGSGSGDLKAITFLRKQFSMTEAAAIMEVSQARLRASKQKKFSQAASMFFSRDGLEQSSGEFIAGHRARRISEHLGAGAKIADLCCGIGGDTTMLSENLSVVGVELDAARLLFAAENAAALGNAEHFSPRLANVLEFSPAQEGVVGAFFDPGRRRKDGKRIYNPADYQPPLASIERWLKELPGGMAAKVAPGIDYDALRQAMGSAGGEKYNANSERRSPFSEMEVEIVSENGEVKEAVLWFGAMRQVNRRATIINTREGREPEFLNFDDRDGVPPLPVVKPGAFLHEPDGALIRSGLLELLGPQLDAGKIDEDIAYLTSDQVSIGPAAHTFSIIEYFPFNLKRLKERLRLLGTGRVTIKKRGSPLKVEELERALHLKGDGEELTLILTKLKGEHTVFLTRAQAK